MPAGTLVIHLCCVSRQSSWSCLSQFARGITQGLRTTKSVDSRVSNRNSRPFWVGQDGKIDAERLQDENQCRPGSQRTVAMGPVARRSAQLFLMSKVDKHRPSSYQPVYRGLVRSCVGWLQILSSFKVVRGNVQPTLIGLEKKQAGLVFPDEKRGEATGLVTDLLCEAIVGKMESYRAVYVSGPEALLRHCARGTSFLRHEIPNKIGVATLRGARKSSLVQKMVPVSGC